MTSAPTDTRRRTPGGVGESASRPDGVPKVRGEFAFSSDLWADGAAWAPRCAARTPTPGSSR